MTTEIDAPPVTRWAHRRRSDLGRAYWSLFAATGVSSLGDGLVNVALPLLAASVTRSPLALGAMLAALRLPWLLFALPLGAIADRVNTRKMAVAVESSRAALLVGLSLLVGAHLVDLPVLYGAAFILGSLEAAFVAATSSAVPDLVPKRSLARANGHLFAANVAADDFIGVGLGGIVFAAVAALPFLLDGASFAASGLLLFAALPAARHAAQRLRPDEPSAVFARIRSDVSVGLRYLVERPAMRALLLSNVALALLQAMVLGILVAFGLGPLHLSRSGYGLFLSVSALGAVIGGPLSGRIIDRFGGPTVLIGTAAGAGLAYVLLGASFAVPLATVVWGVAGFFVIVLRTAVMTLRQERVPSDLQARTNTAFRAIVYGAVPLGALLGGGLASLTSLRAAIALAGVAQIGLVLLAGRWVHATLTDPIVNVDPDLDLRGVETPL